ncbi:MAG: hypothetical protein Fur0037_13770 [Planctomycetota bacterium]
MRVKILGSHLGGLSPTQLRALFRAASSSITANFYDDCVAYAAGANAFRLAVAGAQPSTPEGQLRLWFDNHWITLPGLGQSSLSWVYSDPIDVADIVSQGGWTSATWSGFALNSNVVNSIGGSYMLQPGGGAAEDPGLVDDPLAPGVREEELERLRQHVSQLPGAPSAMSGSNSFAWSGFYCVDPATGVKYPGLLADPHQGLPFYGPYFGAQFADNPNHMWFAHVQVTPVGANGPTLDVFGHFPYAAATSQSAHNRSIAMGGTAGPPNHTDRFVLRLEEDPQTGQPLASAQGSYSYYSYYHDAQQTSDTYRPVVQDYMAIKRPDNTIAQVPYWRFGSYGFAAPVVAEALSYVQGLLPAPQLSSLVVYGEHVNTGPGQSAPPWRARITQYQNQTHPPLPKMRFWKSPQQAGSQWITSPMIVTLRSPMDSHVAGNPLVPGEDRHWLLLRDFWEMAHASTVTEVIPRTNGGAYNVNVCFVDRHGSTFSTQLSSIPWRGDDALLQAAQYSATDKYLIYSGFGGLVPARHYDDRMFDWQFGSLTPADRPAPLRYLDYPSVPFPVPATPFKAMTLQIPLPPSSTFPPQSTAGSGTSFRIEGGLFASATNDQIWGYSRKSDADPATGIPAFMTANGYSWVDFNTNNWLFQKVQEAGTVYQTASLWFEGGNGQQIVVDRFTRVAQGNYEPTSPQVLPPLTPTEMREFAVSPRLYNEPGYTPPPGATANANLPTPIRQLKEVIDNPNYQANPQNADPADPLLRARRELQFFSDLKTNLNGRWRNYTVQPGLQIDLAKLWMEGGDPSQPAYTDQIFWWDRPSDPSNPGIRWIDMPPGFPLIDFVWDKSEIGSGFDTGQAATAATPVGSQGHWNTIVSLVNSLVAWETGVPAPDLYKMRPSSTGACLLEMLRMGYNAQGPSYGRHWKLRQLSNGSWVEEQRDRAWSDLQGLAFPSSQLATLLKGGLNPPYQAIYVNGQGGTVKATLSLQDTNDLVEFFLRLGGHYIRPDFNGGNPSRKLARWHMANDDANTFVKRLPGNYPLTGGLERITVLRRLLDTDVFLGSSGRTFDAHFRARAYDHNGRQLWPDPALGLDTPCVGAGLRSVVWKEDTADRAHTAGRGFQPKFLGMMGSYATLLTLFPSTGGAESWFWCTPGVQAMGYDLRGSLETDRRFDRNMQAYSTNTLLPSHFSDFLTHYVTLMNHYY